MISPFQIKPCKLNGAYVIEPFVATDLRGEFIKDYSLELLKKHGIDMLLKEVFYTISHRGVVRALHFQHTKQQAKLVRCLSGQVFDVIVDLNPSSSTFGQWESFLLSGDNHTSLYIPKHFAHGYLVIDDAIVSYKCDESFYAEYDTGIIWNDHDLNIDWPIHRVENIILSDKDKHLQSFKHFQEVSK